MELWIRSQDKTQLAQITGLLLNDNEIRGFTNYHQNYYELGTYKTKKRALEVLDEIQDTLIAKYVASLNSRSAMLETEEETAKALKRMAVYEMPKE